MRRPNHGCASAVKTKTSPEPPETLAPQFDYWAPKSRISAAFTLTKAPKSGSWVKRADGTVPVIIGEYGNSTSGSTLDANGNQSISAVQASGYGSTAWTWHEGTQDELT